MILTPSTTALCFFFNDTATTEIYPLSLHAALPISTWIPPCGSNARPSSNCTSRRRWPPIVDTRASATTVPITFPSIISVLSRSEEHTSELQSHSDLVCRPLLEQTHTAIPRTCIV